MRQPDDHEILHDKFYEHFITALNGEADRITYNPADK